jgi:hypothetical protein
MTVGRGGHGGRRRGTMPRVPYTARDVGRRILATLPPTLAGRIDLARPSLRHSWGGPLNGQVHRRAIVENLARTIAFDAVIETGTYRGTSTSYFSEVFGVPVSTVENNARFYTYSRSRLSRDARVDVCFGDSRSFLRRQAEQRGSQTVFIYLDAHWENDLPLREELQIIAAGWTRAVVLIDDFAVPGDAGYGFDDYGPGKALIEDELPAMPQWSLYYPTAGSDQETGQRRGCCTLVSPGLSGLRLSELRLARVL